MSRAILVTGLMLVAVSLAGCHEDAAEVDDTPEPSHVERVDLLFVPAGAAPKSSVDVCWSVTGTGTIAHTAVHWSAEAPNTTTPTFQDYGQGVRYPDNRTSAPSAGYGLPDEFCTAFIMPPHTVYLVAHAIGDRDGPPGLLSRQAMIVAAS